MTNPRTTSPRISILSMTHLSLFRRQLRWPVQVSYPGRLVMCNLSLEAVLIRAMVHAIAEAYAVDEVKDLRDKALALEKYAQQALNDEAERKACEIRLMAERKAGQLLKQMTKTKGGSPTGSNQHAKKRNRLSGTTGSSLSDMGVSKDQSSKWQKLAEVPNEDFEEALANPRVMPSTQGIIKTAVDVRFGEKNKGLPDRLFWVNSGQLLISFTPCPTTLPGVRANTN